MQPTAPQSTGLTPQEISSMRTQAGFSSTPEKSLASSPTSLSDTLKQAASKYDTARAPVTPTPSSSTPQTLGQKNDATIKQAGEDVSSYINDSKGTGDNPVTRGFEAAEAAFGGVGKVASNFIPQGIKDAVGKAYDQSIGGVVKDVSDRISGTKTAQDFVTNHPTATNAIEQGAKVGESAGTIAGTILGAEGASQGISKIAEVVPKVTDAVSSGAGSIKEGIKPSLSPEEATGQIVQGDTSDIAGSKKTLQSLDISKIETQADLSKAIDEQIIKPGLKNVDAEFAKDTSGGHSIKSFEQTVGEGKATVKVNYVKQGIEDLKNYYTKTGDAQGLSSMKALENKAKINGLTYKDVNDLARLHGKEINAFNANGEAASGLTKQAAENTRTGLKTTARNGLGTSEAKALDEKVSNAIKTKDLIDKQVEKVNKVNQTTAKVGVIPKAVGKIIKTADIVTGSPLKAIGKAMGNVGSSDRLSPLDLESKLQENLKILKGK